MWGWGQPKLYGGRNWETGIKREHHPHNLISVEWINSLKLTKLLFRVVMNESRDMSHLMRVNLSQCINPQIHKKHHF